MCGGTSVIVLPAEVYWPTVCLSVWLFLFEIRCKMLAQTEAQGLVRLSMTDSAAAFSDHLKEKGPHEVLNA